MIALLMVGATLGSFGPIAHAGEYQSVLELGTTLYSTTDAPSITGSTGYTLGMRAERKKDILRTTLSAELEYASGNASLASGEEPGFTLFASRFSGGYNLFFFKEGAFKPFISANILLGWNLLRLTGQPEGMEPNTLGISYGFEVSAGTDIRFAGGAERAIRVRTIYSQNFSNLAGLSGFNLSGLRIMLGYQF